MVQICTMMVQTWTMMEFKELSIYPVLVRSKIAPPAVIRGYFH